MLLRKPNTHQTNVISFLTKLPPQFNFHSVIDYETQFQKSFFEPLKFILEAINWKVDASGMNTIESFLSKYKPYNLKDVNEASSQNKFNVISTFAGGGGSSTGYRLAGGKILCINEFVEEAQNTYKENYPDTPILPNDIKKLTAKDFTDIAGTTDIDILDGSASLLNVLCGP